MITTRTKTVQLTFQRCQLLYDIKNLAYVEGEQMDPSGLGKKHVQDIGNEGNVDRVTRMLDIAYAECVQALYPYTKEDVDQEMELADVLDETYWYTIYLLVPDDYSKSTVDLLEKYIHEYMVDSVLYDWLSIINPQAAENWLYKKAQLKEQIKTTANFRTGRVRRTLSPF